ncbi:MAG TPA: nucleoside monophosphate kinase [Planctomycetota bacterium]|nr:nucleoside monophosphate kinase [Planctomycetota bacterium]
MGKLENVVIAGKSGAGKQPRVDVLVKEFGLVQLGTGNIFREYLGALKKLERQPDPEPFWDAKADWFVDDGRIKVSIAADAKKAGVPLADAVLGLKAARFVNRGLFVPDRITNDLFAAAFAKLRHAGAILDGYPRTTDQARFLLDLLAKAGKRLDLVLVVHGEDEDIIRRTLGRRICPKKECAKVFHVEFKPPRDGKFCSACGTEVILRSDDSEEKIRSRLREFEEKAKPAVDFLAAQGVKVATVNGNLPKFSDEAVRESVMTALAAAGV